MELLGIRLYKYRRSLNLTLAEVAKDIIAISYLSKIETGTKVPSIETAIDLQKRLHMPTLTNDLDDAVSIMLLEKYATIFQLLLSEKKIEARDELLAIERVYNLALLPIELELSHYLILATVHILFWELDKTTEIEEKVLIGLSRFNAAKLPPYIHQYYAYFQARKAFHSTEYQEALQHLHTCIKYSTSHELISSLYIISAMSAICLSNYELSESYLETAQAFLLRLPIEAQGRSIQLFYLEGFTLFHHKYYTRAERAFLQAKTYYPFHPEFAPAFSLLIEFYLYLLYVESNNEKSIEQFDILYTLLESKEGSYVPNDFLVINEVMILLAEQQAFEKGLHLRSIIAKEEHYFGEFEYSLPYFDALLAESQGNLKEYERIILNLLPIIDQSNEPKLIERVKKQASNYFVKHKKYKSALEALK